MGLSGLGGRGRGGFMVLQTRLEAAEEGAGLIQRFLILGGGVRVRDEAAARLDGDGVAPLEPRAGQELSLIDT